VVNLESRSRPNIELLLVGRQAPDPHPCR